ncbi:SDH family Clp fold serine proteinase [Acidovorax sp. RAC01]|uniref:SDH family Clp fold serine proteinase n=1 Tax=Acidovorax sp. RAC01 TaxID=1842533 RepID=UPI0008577D40|nr:hypothetical protein [Acidovorax sp. RAC01]AOG24150.1 serine dehydrogenase ase family protein [Acidovorax sp. RAC01]
MATDVYMYSGMVSTAGYDGICAALTGRECEKALLVLATPGGDPHAGFRIARALQHHYGSFDALVPRYCKSAGTLMLVGASRLFLGDKSELGPLDIQVKKNDEVVGRNSGLDILQAVTYLRTQAMEGFRTYLHELTQEMRLSTRVASDIASKLTTGIFEPIFEQIDPMKLAEMQRAMEIAYAYGQRLNEQSNNLRAEGLQRLVTSYPSHEFVIDRREAKSIFTAVHKPEGLLSVFSEALLQEMMPKIGLSIPEIRRFKVDFVIDGDGHVANQNPTGVGTGSTSGEPEVSGSSQDVNPSTANSTASSGTSTSGHA